MEEVRMFSRSALRALAPMHDDDKFERLEQRIERLTDEISQLRLEMRDESGKLRLDMRDEFGKVRVETAGLRAEMIDRNVNLLKWLLGFFAAQTAALAALLALFR
jgi:hypothetical protein